MSTHRRTGLTSRRRLIAGVVAGASTVVLTVGAAGAAHSETALPQADQDFLAAAHRTNLTEMAAGERAAFSSCPVVQRLGRTFVADHNRLDGLVTAVAGQYGYTLPALPDADQQQMLARVTPMMGHDFDIAWLQAQEQGHLTAQQDGRQELGTGTTPQVRSVAEQATPIVDEHLGEVRAAFAEC